jgi:hypothetical protein
METIETYLPVFSGFYGTIWEPDESDYLYESGFESSDIDFDLESYERDTLESICDFVEKNCPFIKSVKLQKVVSPKEYNFINDSANVEICVNAEELAKYLIKNESLLNDYLKGKYTSCSGFISFYSNKYNDWYEETEGFNKLDIDTHRLGSLLDFYFANEFEDAEEYAYYSGCKPYEGFYIIPNKKIVSDLDVSEKIKVAKNIIDSDFVPFGYLALLYSDYKNRFPDYWAERLAESEYGLIISESGIDKVGLDLELID